MVITSCPLLFCGVGMSEPLVSSTARLTVDHHCLACRFPKVRCPPETRLVAAFSLQLAALCSANRDLAAGPPVAVAPSTTCTLEMASWCHFSLVWFGCQKQTKKLTLDELAASLQAASLRRLGSNMHLWTPAVQLCRMSYDCRMICSRSFLVIHNFRQFTLRSLQDQVDTPGSS